jgi:hypothetical protein
VVATLETKNVGIAEDFAEEIGLSYGQYVNHRVSKGVTEQYEDLWRSLLNPTSSAMGQSRRFGPPPMTSGLPPEADTVTAGRHVSKVP